MASIFVMVFLGSASSVNTAMEQKKESIKNIGLWGFIWHIIWNCLIYICFWKDYFGQIKAGGRYKCVKKK